MRYLLLFSLSFLMFLILQPLKASVPTDAIAEVVKLRGEATQLSPGAHVARNVSLGDKFVEDTSILTGAKSFIKIKFIDNSELNIGPDSKIVISEMKKDSVGIISLLKGRIRTEVQKNAQPGGNKFFIKTRTAAMGVRGTDFQTIYNPDNKMTSLLTYKGEVAMAKIDEKTYKRLEGEPTKVILRDDVTKAPEIREIPAQKMDEVAELNKLLKQPKTVLVPPGQNAFSSDALKKASLPVKISPVQLNALYNNQDFQEKTAANLNLQSAAAPDSTQNAKSRLKVAAQSAPAEGLYNEKTGDFAPRSGGFIDLKTGLYVAPENDAVLDVKSGVYVPKKSGDIDADTGQYVAPKGLVLDAKKGFILESEADKKPELLALSEDLNKNIAKDIIVFGDAQGAASRFKINEKFIRDRVTFSLWSINQNIKSNENSTSNPFLELDSKSSARFALVWNMATNNRFSPSVAFDYGVVNFGDRSDIPQGSKKQIGLSFGTQYALNRVFNLFANIGLHQDHFLDTTSVGGTPTYALSKVVLTRFVLGANAEFWKDNLWSMDAKLGGLVTFRKRINNIVINEGTGYMLEVLPKYRLKEHRWLGLGLNLEKQSQRVNGTLGENKMNRRSSGLELKFITEF